jgi:hypothetical protein
MAMASEAQIAANRLNALKSTGPNTPRGKAASAWNALKHGMTAATVVMFDEVVTEFEAFRAGFVSDFEPQGTAECALVERIAMVAWRLRRASRAEAAMANKEAVSRRLRLEDEPPHPLYPMDASILFDAFTHDMETLTRYEAAMERQLNRAIALLERLQARRLKHGEREEEESGDRPLPEPGSATPETSPPPAQAPEAK